MLVPAFMSIIGERIWWLPAWLDRILPNVDIEGETLMARLDDTPAPVQTADQLA
jgi:RND superfamily putative drug exporter